MKKSIIITASFLAIFSTFASAQQVRTLEECRQLAIKNNKELKIAGQKIEVAANDKKAAFTKYFPQVSATGAYFDNQKDLNLLDMIRRWSLWTRTIRLSAVNSSVGLMRHLMFTLLRLVPT